MTLTPEWWQKPRRVSVVVDNDSWLLPHAEDLVRSLIEDGDEAALCRAHGEVGDGAVAFYLGCVTMTPADILARNRRNLVVHESDLPRGRGFSPLTWQVLEGAARIPVCLLDATGEADAGPVVYRAALEFQGAELIDEMRHALGRLTISLCRRFMAEGTPPDGVEQQGEASLYPRRSPEDSRLDPHKTIAEQFDLLRVVDNHRYPAFFDFRGRRYHILVGGGEPEQDGEG